MSAMGYQTNNGVNYTPDPNNILQQQFSAPTAAQAQATPGYQFTLDQGLKSTQNSAAARGLGSSGAALKGAASYSTGLADSTYNDVYNRALNTFNTNYNSASQNVGRLQTLANNGQNAALGTAAAGSAASNTIGTSLSSAGSAAAQGQVGAAAANASGLNTLGNSLTTAANSFNNSSGSTGANPLQTAIANASDDPIASLNAQKGWTS